MPIEVLHFSIAALVVLGAYFVRGVSGFGSGLVSVPLLALMFPLQEVVPFVVVTDLTASLLLGRANRKAIAWSEIAPLLPGSLAGVVFGTVLLLLLDRSRLLVGLGLVVVFFGLRSLLGLEGSRPASRLWALPASLAGGTMGALFGTGGPPYVIYLRHRIRDKGVFRATTSALLLFDGGLRVAAFAIAGLLFEARLLTSYLAALPLMGLGLALGHRVHLALSPATFGRAIGVLLVASGLSLLWKAAH